MVLFIFFISTPPMESPDVAWNRQVNVSITFVPSNKECYPCQQDLNIQPSSLYSVKFGALVTAYIQR